MLSYNVLNSWVEKMMKKNLPVKIKTSNITTLSTKDINKLKAGDIVLKKTGNQNHTYVVTYKEDKQGICLTYTDASVIETVSYDYNTTTKEWVYNSTDIGRVGGVEYSAGTGIQITDNHQINNTNKLYVYNVYVNESSSYYIHFSFISNITRSLTSLDDIKQFLRDYEYTSNSYNTFNHCQECVGRTQSINDVKLLFLYTGGSSDTVFISDGYGTSLGISSITSVQTLVHEII